MAKYFILTFLSGGVLVKKWWMVVLFTVFLTGCVNVGELETMNDDFVMPEAVPGQILLSLPGDAGEEALCGTTDRQLYICENYTIADCDRLRTVGTDGGADHEEWHGRISHRLDGCRRRWRSALQGGDPQRWELPLRPVRHGGLHRGRNVSRAVAEPV